jgi:hypothetical protein
VLRWLADPYLRYACSNYPGSRFVPEARLGARFCSIEISKAVVSADPSSMSASPIPCNEREAIRVILALLLRGTEPRARFPLGDRPYTRVKAILEPHSSRKTSLPASSVWACSFQAARSSSLSLQFASSFFHFYRTHAAKCVF